jgi:hypothetical protein
MEGKHMMTKKALVLAGTMVFVMIMTQGICSADKISNYNPKWQAIDFQGQIMELGPKGDYLVVSERKVVLVDFVAKQGKHRRTCIADANGNKIKFSGLKKGMWIYVRGDIMDNRGIAARVLLVTTGQVSDAVLMRKFSPWMNKQQWDMD